MSNTLLPINERKLFEVYGLRANISRGKVSLQLSGLSYSEGLHAILEWKQGKNCYDVIAGFVRL